MRLPERFREAWRHHLINMNSGSIFDGDTEPTAVAYGLDDWETNAIKKQVLEELLTSIRKDK